MGCVSSKEDSTSNSPPPNVTDQQTQQRAPPQIPVEDKQKQKRLREELGVKEWQQKISTWYPAPFPKIVLGKNTFLNETEYKNYMAHNYQYEFWENQVLLMSRKMYKHSEEMWSTSRLLWIAKLKGHDLISSLPKEILMEIIDYITSGKLQDYFHVLVQEAKKNAAKMAMTM